MKRFPKYAVLVIITLAMVMGCAPSLYVTPSAKAPDGSEFFSVVTKTNGHPAVTGFQTFRKQGESPAAMVADHSGSATGAAVAIPAAALQGTGAALALGLPAALLRPDQTNVTQAGGGATQGQNQGIKSAISNKSTNVNTNKNTNVNKPTATATGGAGGKGGDGGTGIGIGGAGGASTIQKGAVSNVNNVDVF